MRRHTLIASQKEVGSLVDGNYLECIQKTSLTFLGQTKWDGTLWLRVRKKWGVWLMRTTQSSFTRCGEAFIISQHWHVTHEELLKEAPVITGSYPHLFIAGNRVSQLWNMVYIHVIGPDQQQKLSVKRWIFFCPTVLHVLDAQKNRLIETHYICFGWKIRKINFDHALSSRGLVMHMLFANCCHLVDFWKMPVNMANIIRPG